MSAIETFFDTNVLIYEFSEDAGKAGISENLLRGGGVVSVQVLTEFASVGLRKLRMEWSVIRDILREFRNGLAVVPLTIEMHERGLDLAERYGLNVYDATIAASAQLAGCTVLYSEDMHDGLVIDRLMIRNPYAAGR